MGEDFGQELDRALSVQVLEYVADIPTALAEMHRALRPGGRVVIWDVDWATVPGTPRMLLGWTGC
jgi:ubiquinone/menaquinone biosynthesis C-methylase UbiE